MDIIAILASPKLDQTAMGLPLFYRPTDGHVVHVASKLEIGLVEETGIWVVAAKGESRSKAGGAWMRLRHVRGGSHGLKMTLIGTAVMVPGGCQGVRFVQVRLRVRRHMWGDHLA